MVSVAGKAVAQDYIRVEGYVFNKEAPAEKGSEFKYQFYNIVKIFLFDTEEAGTVGARKLRDYVYRMKKGEYTGREDVNAIINAEGTVDLSQRDEWPYRLSTVSPEGTLLFWDTNGGEVKEVKVRGRDRIDVEFSIKTEGLSLLLEKSVLTVSTRSLAPPEPVEDMGDTLRFRENYQFPGWPQQRMGKSDARFALQSFIVSSSDETDTLEYRNVVVMDGKEYHATQLRRMGYDGSRDVLYDVAEKLDPLTDSTAIVYWQEVIPKNDKNKNGILKAYVWFEDYNHVYHTEHRQLKELKRTWNRMRFLEYSLKTLQMDPYDRYNVRVPEKKPVNGDISLHIEFATGKAVIDPKDTASTRELDFLKNTVYELTHTDGKKLMRYSIVGVASPEGSYARNTALARERLDYIDRQVKSEISAEAMMGMRKTGLDSRVATWEEFADTLANYPDLASYAEEIRGIVASYPNSMDQQFAKIRHLPYYNTVIKDNLHKLRRVNFVYTTVVYREWTPEETMDRYYNDPQYKENPRYEEFADAELWTLMLHMKDTTELEKICRRAIRMDNRSRNKKPEDLWALPANILATICLNRNKPDTTILAPYIDVTQPRVDWEFTDMNGNHRKLNPTPIIANQVAMMIQSEHNSRAVYLAGFFKNSDDPAMQQLYAIARCKAGYFKPDTPEGLHYWEMVHDSSPRNAVVMDMAIPAYVGAVRDELEELDPEDPVTYYLKAQFECFEFYQLTQLDRMGLMNEDTQTYAIRNLVKAFQMDPKLIDEASNDWFIFSDLYKSAKQEYDEPGSVLPPMMVDESGHAKSIDEIIAEMTEEQKNDIIMRGNAGDLTDDEWPIFDKLSGF